MNERVTSVWHAAAYDAPSTRSAKAWCVLGLKVVGVGFLLSVFGMLANLAFAGMLPASGTVSMALVDVAADTFSGLVNGVLALAFMLVCKSILRVAADEGYFEE